MSVKDRIKAMNMKLSGTLEEAPPPPAPIEKSRVSRSISCDPVKDRIQAMNKRCTTAVNDIDAPGKKVLRSWSSDNSKTRRFEPPSRTRSVEGSMKTPMKLPGLLTDKGASKFEEQDPNETDVEDVIQRLKENDPSLTEVNLNNHVGLDSDLIVEIFDAMKENNHLEILLMCNVRVDENHAFILAEVLSKNCSLRVLNVESNRITRKGIKAIMKALSENQDTILKELRMVNQYFTGGAGAEGEIARYLAKIKTITKLGYNFTVPSFRTKVDGFIMRNLDYERKRRTAQTS